MHSRSAGPIGAAARSRRGRPHRPWRMGGGSEERFASAGLYLRDAAAQGRSGAARVRFREACAAASAAAWGEEGSASLTGSEALAERLRRRHGLRDKKHEMGSGKPADFEVIPRERIPEGATIAKSLVWEYRQGEASQGGWRPVCVVLGLDRKVDRKALSAVVSGTLVELDGEVEGGVEGEVEWEGEGASGVGVRMMKVGEAEKVTGFTVGNIPPLGHLTSVPLVVDTAMVEGPGSRGEAVVYCGGGEDGRELRIKLKALVAQPHCVVARISKRTKEEEEDIQMRSSSVASSPAPARGPESGSGGQWYGKDDEEVSSAALRQAAMKERSSARVERLLAQARGAPHEWDEDSVAKLVNARSGGGGKNSLHNAAWRGALASVRLLLDAGGEIEGISVGDGNYGKTPIFYALTRCRDDAVELLLGRGASVLVVNNKGQTPVSLAQTHLTPRYRAMVELAEAEQLAQGGVWRNFRESHADTSRAYGDLDPRFGLDPANGFPNGGADIGEVERRAKVVRPTTFEARASNFATNAAPGKTLASNERGPAWGRGPDWETKATGAGAEEHRQEEDARGVSLPCVDIGSDVCHLVGVLTSQRKMARCLRFANIVPPPDPGDRDGCLRLARALAKGVADAHAWSDAGDGKSRLAVQLIMGKTMRELLGEEEAVNKLKKLRVGQLVYVTGRLGVNNEQGNANYEERATVDVVVSDLRVIEDSFHVGYPLDRGVTEAALAEGLAGTERQQLGMGAGRGSTKGMDVLSMADVGDRAVVLVDDLRGVAELSEGLEALRVGLADLTTTGLGWEQDAEALTAGCVGLDCEWQPSSNGGRSNPVTLMQLAVGNSQVYLVDVMTLCRAGCEATEPMNAEEHALNEVLGPLFAPGGCLAVLGFSVDGDLSKLRRSFPHMPCFASVDALVDLSGLAGLALGRGWRSGSLSKLCSLVLGKRLDKSQQCSAWHERPLVDEQLAYASLDAACLCSLLGRMLPLLLLPGWQQGNGTGAGKEGVQSGTDAPPAGVGVLEAYRIPAPAWAYEEEADADAE